MKKISSDDIWTAVIIGIGLIYFVIIGIIVIKYNWPQ